MKAPAPSAPSDLLDGLLNSLRRSLKLIPEDRSWLRAAALAGLARVERAFARKPSPQIQAALDDFLCERNPWGIHDYLVHEREKIGGDLAERSLEIMAYGFIVQDPESAEAAVDEVLSANPDDADALHWKGVIQRWRGRLGYAETLFARAAKLADAANDPEAKADALLNLALVHRAQGQAGKAEKAFQKASEIRERLGSAESLYFASVQLARHYVAQDDLKKAEKMHLRAAEVAESLGRWDCVADCLYSVGLLHAMSRSEPPAAAGKRAPRTNRSQAALRKAEAPLVRSLEINAELRRVQPMIAACEALEDIYLILGQTEEAAAMGKRAEELRAEKVFAPAVREAVLAAS